MRLGGTNSATHFSSRPLWIEAGSPIEGPLQRIEYVIVMRYRWGLCECRAESNSGRLPVCYREAPERGGCTKGIADHAVR